MVSRVVATHRARGTTNAEGWSFSDTLTATAKEAVADAEVTQGDVAPNFVGHHY
jgi:hypothetical protein